MLRVSLLILACLAPGFASALVPAPVAVGVATSGSSTSHDSGEICLTVLTPMLLEVHLVAGGPTDVLRVVADAVEPYPDPVAFASIGSPARIQYVSPDSCAHFTVEGLRVETVAVYQAMALRLASG